MNLKKIGIGVVVAGGLATAEQEQIEFGLRCKKLMDSTGCTFYQAFRQISEEMDKKITKVLKTKNGN